MVLRIAAWTEVVSLAVGAVVRETGDLRTRLLAALPAVGAVVAVRRIERRGADNWVA